MADKEVGGGVRVLDQRRKEGKEERKGEERKRGKERKGGKEMKHFRIKKSKN